MSSLHQYLTDDISDENYCWDNADDGDATLDLGLDDRADFYATLNAIHAARIEAEINAAWAQHEANGDGD